MKKHILLTLAAAGLFLAACGEQPAQSSSPTPTPSSESSIVPTSSSDSSAASSDSSAASSDSSAASSDSSAASSDSSSSEAATITEVTVAVDEGEKDTIAIGGQTLVVATVTGTGAFSRDVVWSSSNPAIATVTAGVVTGVAAGDVNIIATSAADSTKKGQVTIHIVDKTAGAKTVAELYADEDLAKLKNDGSESSEKDYVVKAYVAYISEDYSEQFKNIGFYVIDDMSKLGGKDGKLIQIYRAKADEDVPDIDLTKLKANDQVWVSGKIKNYKGTYEFNPASVVKVVAGEPLPSVSEIKDAAAGKVLDIAEATVVATSTKGFVINDGGAAIYVYESKTPTLAVGDVVSLKGNVLVALGDHGYLQVSNAGLKYEKLTDKTPIVENATILTPELATGLAAQGADTLASHKLYKWTTTIGKSGNYLTYPVAGSETVIEASYPSTELAGKEGDKVNIEAYYVGYDTKYHYACVVIKSIEEWHAAAESIEIQGEDSVAVEDNITLTATVSPAEASQDVTWDVDDHDLAEIDENGVLTGKAVGEVTVTATHATDTAITQSKTIEITAAHADPVTGVTVKATETVAMNKTVTLTAEVSSAGEDYNPNVTWSSGDTKIATVDKNGVVTGVAAGEVTITATTVGKNAAGQHETAQCVVTVTNPYGTAEAPIDVAAAIALTNALEDNGVTPVPMYVTGIVKDVTYKWNETNMSFTMIDEGKEPIFTAFKAVLGTEVDVPSQNDLVVVSGYGTKYVSGTTTTLEFSPKNSVDPTVLSTVRQSSTITLGNHDHATVTGLAENATNGTVQNFTVAVDSGYKIASVTLNGSALVENEGAYSFTVDGDATIAVTAVSDSLSTVTKTSAEVFTLNNWVISAGQDAHKYDAATLDDVISMSFSGTGNTASAWGDSKEIRIYGAKNTDTSTITFTAATGYAIKSVNLTFTTTNSAVVKYGTNAVTSGTAVEINAASATFNLDITGITNNSQLRITNFEVIYGVAN
ncbi:MAG: hypothetical protein E7179_03900 [Erysipelotrichaceae bacterium]|nr:hypothetical protein [Erysipelotrichaceae bacterium]